jgi:hypothetical protein
MADTVNVQLPAGMTKEQFDALFANFTKKRVANSSKNKAKRQATNELIKNHKDEFDKLLVKYMPKK